MNAVVERNLSINLISLNIKRNVWGRKMNKGFLILGAALVNLLAIFSMFCKVVFSFLTMEPLTFNFYEKLLFIGLAIVMALLAIYLSYKEKEEEQKDE